MRFFTDFKQKDILFNHSVFGMIEALDIEVNIG